jgi:periplasmic copper chaperone A
MKHPVYVMFIFCLSLLSTVCAGAGEISVTNSWIREAPPVAKTLAAYMTISNSSTHTVQLESAAGADFKKVEIHRTETHDGMSHMIRQSSLMIEGGGNVTLAPGGYHLMLIQPGRTLKAGDKVGLQLHFNNGETVDVTAVVRSQ